MKGASILLALILSSPSLQASQTPGSNRVESIEIRGNRRIPSNTIKYNIQTKAGDVLNPDVIRRDVRTLYAQGFFDDIRVDEEDGKNGGVVVIFVIKEKPLIRNVDFMGANSISKSDILDKLKEKKISIGQESPYDPERVKQVERVIKSMLAEKGHQDATVETTTEDIPPNSIKLTFQDRRRAIHQDRKDQYRRK